MSRKRINVVIIHSSFVIGGAENMVYELAKSFDLENINPTVITLHSPVHSSLEDKVEKAKIHNIFANCEGRVTLKKLFHVYQLVKKEKPSIIHAHMSGVIYGLPWVLTHDTKMVVTAHTTPNKAFNARTTKILTWLAKKKKVLLVAVSDENEMLMLKEYGLCKSSIRCVNNGIDLSRYYQKEHRGTVFINVGRHDANKNQAQIIRLFYKIHMQNQDSKLILCGEGPEHDNLLRQVKELGLSDAVKFTGNVSNVQDYLADADIYVQSSHREGLPLSVIEAMASGLPVISTDVGGMKNIVRDNGFLVPDNDDDKMLNAMIRLSEDKQMCKEMGKKSKIYSIDFSAQEMSSNYEQIYRELI